MAYNQTAKGISALGRKGDDTLLHVSKEELAGLQSLLGPISVNPDTGLPEAFAWKDVLTTGLIGIAGALTGGAAMAAAPAIGWGGSMAVGAGQGALLGGALSSAEGKGFGSGALGGAISGGLGGYGGAGSFDAAGVGTDTAGKAGLGKAIPDTVISPTTASPLPITPAESLSSIHMPSGFGGLQGEGSAPLLSAKTPYDFSFKAPSFNKADFAPDFGNKTALQYTSQDVPFINRLGSGVNQQAKGMFTNKAGMESLLYPVGAGTALGTAATDMIQQGNAERELAQQQQALADANALDQQQYFASLGYELPPLAALNNPSSAAQRDYIQNIINPRGAAAGGSMAVQLPIGGAQVSAVLPPKYVGVMEKVDIPSEQNEIKNELGLATGGYINNQPVDPNNFYPQSQIHSAQPYAAATPQRHEVLDYYKDGGFLDGPGDGMSDDIPANIDGEEEIRLADGEFVVPPDLVRILGFGDPEKGAKLLDNLLPIVRQASHGKKTQIKQDAGKLAAEKMLVRAAKGKKA